MKACPTCGQKFLGTEEFCPKDGVELVELDKADEDDLIGTTIDGRYTVEKKLGEGGMGVVYLATHAVIGKSCAVKVLRGDLSSEDEVSERFTQEARAAAAIGNEHIIEITDFGKLADGASYFVMEYLDGLSLHEALQETPQMTIEQVLKIIQQCCDALAAAHNADIVHRDLKPENIFLVNRHGRSDFIKILDFGIAKVARETGRLTRTGMVFGTPQYMSPEQAAGTNVDWRTDVYSLGIIMYEMLCGHVPFQADTFMGVLTKHLYEEPVPPARLVPPVKVPRSLEATLLKAIAKKPDKRYQTMADFGQDVQALIDGKTPTIVYDQMRETAATTLPPVPPSEIVGGSSSSDDVDDKLIGLKSRWPVLAGVGAVVIIAVVAIAIILGGEDKKAVEAQPVGTALVKPQPVDPAAENKQVKEADEKKSTEEKDAPPKIAQVTVESTPAGAYLYKGDALLGQLPFKVDKPRSGQPAERLKIKLAGYKDVDVVVMSTTPDPFSVTLAKKEKEKSKDKDEKSSRRSKRRSKKRSKNRSKKITGDIADPWAN